MGRFIFFFYKMMLHIKNNRAIVIGISGTSCAGKTTTAKKLRNYFNKSNKFTQSNKNFPKKCLLFSQDQYYKPYSTLPINQATNHIEFDEPECIDFEKFLSDWQTSKNDSAAIIILEGSMLFTQKSFLENCDLKYFFEVSFETAKQRREARTLEYEQENEKENDSGNCSSPDTSTNSSSKNNLEDLEEGWVPEHPEVMELNVWPNFVKHKKMMQELIEENDCHMSFIDCEEFQENDDVLFEQILKDVSCKFM